jgi:hypothetical protein
MLVEQAVVDGSAHVPPGRLGSRPSFLYFATPSTTAYSTGTLPHLGAFIFGALEYSCSIHLIEGHLRGNIGRYPHGSVGDIDDDAGDAFDACVGCKLGVGVTAYG